MCVVRFERVKEGKWYSKFSRFAIFESAVPTCYIFFVVVVVVILAHLFPRKQTLERARLFIKRLKVTPRTRRSQSSANILSAEHLRI